MVQIVPVVNVKTYKKFQDRIGFLKDFSGIFQIDVSDGKFCSFKNWADPAKIKKIRSIKRKFEFHLMVDSPEKSIEDFLEAYPLRVIVHIESLKNFDFLKETCQKQEERVELGLAINPFTEVQLLKKYLDKKMVNFVLVLGVEPGPSGQKFQWFVLDRIKELRKKYPHLNIELDGGINEEIALKAKEAGANLLAIGSYLFESKNPKERLKKLEELLNK
ncbi:MAG: hypothetical protein AB7D02_01635 [Candidatus Paceibacterota bacterium]